MNDEPLEFRLATTRDLPGIHELARRGLGWSGGDEDVDYFHWKHFENPFGVSPMWIALHRDRVVGLRALLRWQLTDSGRTISAVRAVDTATDPEYQGRQIFTRLTLGALDSLHAEGVRLIFNTPNAASLPGYLKMGWTTVGRLPVSARLCGLGSALSLFTARRAASRSPIETSLGEPARDVFADEDAIQRLLSTRENPTAISTATTAPYLSWRYGHRPLGYRVLLHGASAADGLTVFRLRRRGDAVEAAICDVLAPEPDPTVKRKLIREIGRRTDATYMLRLGGAGRARDGFVRVPRTGPVLACRRLDAERVPSLHQWGLVLGDVELL